MAHPYHQPSPDGLLAHRYRRMLSPSGLYVGGNLPVAATVQDFLNNHTRHVDVSTLPKDEATCDICWDEYGKDKTGYGNSEQPIRIGCSNNHVFGNSCFEDWVGRGENAHTCPKCRAELFIPLDSIRLMRTGPALMSDDNHSMEELNAAARMLFAYRSDEDRQYEDTLAALFSDTPHSGSTATGTSPAVPPEGRLFQPRSRPADTGTSTTPTAPPTPDPRAPFGPGFLREIEEAAEQTSRPRFPPPEWDNSGLQPTQRNSGNQTNQIVASGLSRASITPRQESAFAPESRRNRTNGLIAGSRWDQRPAGESSLDRPEDSSVVAGDSAAPESRRERTNGLIAGSRWDQRPAGESSLDCPEGSSVAAGDSAALESTHDRTNGLIAGSRWDQRPASRSPK